MENSQHLLSSEDSEGKRTEKLLVQSNERLLSSALVSKSGNWEFDLNTRRITASDGARKLYGILGDEWIYEEIRLIPLPEYREMLDEGFSALINFGTIYDFEFKIKQQNTGHIIDIHSIAEFDPIRKIIVGVIQDVSERKKAEEELINSEGKYRDLANSLPVGLFESDLVGTITFANDTLMSWLNYNSSDIIAGLNLYQFIPKIEHGKARERFEELISKSLQTSSEYTAIRKDGSSFPVLVSSCIIKKNGVATGTRGTLADITERKMIEEALNASDKLLSNLVEKMPDGVYKSTSEGRFVSVNPAMVSMLGYSSKEELMGVDIRKELYFDPDERSALVSKNTIGGSEVFRLRRKDNSEIWVEDHGWYNFDKNGNTLYHEGIIRDVTERKRVEDKLRILSKTVEYNPSSIIITDAKGSIEFANNAFTLLTQYTLDDVINRTPRIFNRGHIPDADFDLMWDTLSAGKVWKGEFQNRRKDNLIYWEDVTISSLMNNSGVISNFILVMNDISDKKKMLDDLIQAKESAEESNRLKSAFLAMMNHELRTPLTHILGFSELIMSGVASEDNINFAASIQSSGQNLLSIIEGVFDLALMDNTKIKLNKQTFSIMDHYMESKASFDHILSTSSKQSQISLVFKPDTHWLSSYITTDRGKINQVLTNLFKNAVKFTHEGTIEFGFSVENESYIKYFIKDTGIGIPKEKQSIIFDYFTQVDDSYTRVYGGIGVGLAISQKITKILQGELSVDSTPGDGSVFSFTLPVELAYIKD